MFSNTKFAVVATLIVIAVAAFVIGAALGSDPINNDTQTSHQYDINPAAACTLQEDGSFVCKGNATFVCQKGDSNVMFASANIYGECFYQDSQGNVMGK
jgi:hypothetical protein